MASKNSHLRSEAADSLWTARGSWFFRSMLMGVSGLVLLFGGRVYGVVMVGVPYQDPTPEMAQREAFHTAVSGWAIAIGGLVLLLSIVAVVVVVTFRFVSRSRS